MLQEQIFRIVLLVFFNLKTAEARELSRWSRLWFVMDVRNHEFFLLFCYFDVGEDVKFFVMFILRLGNVWLILVSGRHEVSLLGILAFVLHSIPNRYTKSLNNSFQFFSSLIHFNLKIKLAFKVIVLTWAHGNCNIHPKLLWFNINGYVIILVKIIST